MDYKTTIVNLKILGQIDNGTKLNTRETNFILDEYTRLQGLLRFYRRDDRSHTITKIELLIKDIQKLVKSIQKNEFNKDDALPYLNLDNMRSDIDKAITGLEKLKETYKEDKTTCAKLEIEISTLTDLRDSIPVPIDEKCHDD